MTNQITQYEANGKLVNITEDDIRKHIARGSGTVTDSDVAMFLNLCQYQGLNPWLNEAYLVKYDPKTPAQIVVGKEAYMKRAQAQLDFDHIEAGIIVERNGETIELEGSFKLPKDLLLGGWAKVFRKGVEKPMTQKISVAEYSTGKSLWGSKPCTMIRKVAIVQALRETYPEQLGALFIEEEQRKVIEEVPTETNEKTKSFSKTAKPQSLPSQKEVIDLDDGDIEEVPLASQEKIANLFEYTRGISVEDKAVKEKMESLFDKSKTAELTDEDVVTLLQVITDEYVKDENFLGEDFVPVDGSEFE